MCLLDSEYHCLPSWFVLPYSKIVFDESIRCFLLNWWKFFLDWVYVRTHETMVAMHHLFEAEDVLGDARNEETKEDPCPFLSVLLLLHYLPCVFCCSEYNFWTSTHRFVLNLNLIFIVSRNRSLLISFSIMFVLQEGKSFIHPPYIQERIISLILKKNLYSVSWHFSSRMFFEPDYLGSKRVSFSFLPFPSPSDRSTVYLYLNASV